MNHSDYEKYFIHFLGTFGSGKTTLARSIGSHLGVEYNPVELVHSDPDERILLLGKCSNSGKYQGMDRAKIKQIERFQLIEDHWNDPHKLIIVDGSMIIYWASFFAKYQDLSDERLVWGMLLNVPNEVIRKRFKERSGREWSEKRSKNVDQKRNSSNTTFNKALSVDKYRMESVKHYSKEHFDHIIGKIQRMTGLDLEGCTIK